MKEHEEHICPDCKGTYFCSPDGDADYCAKHPQGCGLCKKAEWNVWRKERGLHPLSYL